MERRTVIKNLIYLGGLAFLLPACLQKDGKPPVEFKNLNVTAKEEAMLAELCETIIPATDTPGAKAFGAHLFALLMVNDCYTKDLQEKFLGVLKAFEADVKKGKEISFADCSPAEKAAVLKRMEVGRIDNAGLTYFYTTVKRLTLQAYTTSQYFLTNVQPYQLVPGHYYGCVPVDKRIIKS